MMQGVSNEAIVNIVENNNYRALTHMSLKYKQGNDEAIKKYLATKLKESKDQNE